MKDDEMASETDQYYMIISSNECDHIYSLNTSSNFLVEFPSLLMLGTNWEVALTEFWCKSGDNREQVNICVDFCVESLVNGKFMNLLRRVEIKRGHNHIQFTNPCYLPVTRSQLKTISFYLKTHTGNPVSFLRGEVTVQLHFRKRVKQIF